MPENIPIQLPQQPPSVVQPPEDPLIVIDDQQIPPVQLPHGNIEIPGKFRILYVHTDQVGIF